MDIIDLVPDGCRLPSIVSSFQSSSSMASNRSPSLFKLGEAGAFFVGRLVWEWG